MNVNVGRPVPGNNVTDNYDPVYVNDRTVGVLVLAKEKSQTVFGQPAKNPFTATWTCGVDENWKSNSLGMGSNRTLLD